jgi:hypothetical protein
MRGWRSKRSAARRRSVSDGRKREARNADADSDAPYQEIGRLKVELDWLKKKSACRIEEMRPLVERDRPETSVRRQCELLDVNRFRLYYEPVGRKRGEPPAHAVAG